MAKGDKIHRQTADEAFAELHTAREVKVPKASMGIKYDEAKHEYTCKDETGKVWKSTDGKIWEREDHGITITTEKPAHDVSPCHILDIFDSQSHALEHPVLFSSQFVKKDSGKLKWSLLPFEELKDVVKVLMHGAEKYSPDNWKKCDDTTRYKDALMRHIIAYVSGEKTDEEFGLSHLAHAICNCLFLMWFDKHKENKDD